MAARSPSFELIKRELLETPLSRLFDPRSVRRGERYWEEDRVVNIDLSNIMEIKARVLGNYMPFYDVTIDMRSSRQIRYICTCPIERDCKHVVAVILALRNEWRDAIERKLSLFIHENPLEINLVDIYRNSQQAVQKLQQYFKRMGQNKLARTMATFFAAHPDSLVDLVHFLGECDDPMGLAKHPSEKDHLRDLMRIITGSNKALRKELESLFLDWHFGDHSYLYTDVLLDEWRYKRFNDSIFMPILRYLQGINGTLSQIWAPWKVAFEWMSHDVLTIIRDYRDSFISTHHYYIFEDVGEDDEHEKAVELYFLLQAPIRQFLLQFIQACWSRGNEVDNETMIAIFSHLGDVLLVLDTSIEHLEHPTLRNIQQARKKIRQNWIQVLTAALNPSKDQLTFIKRHYRQISRSSSSETEERMIARMIVEGVRQFERQGKNQSLLKIATVLENVDEANDFLEFLRQTSYQNDHEFQYQLIMAFLHENWAIFNDLFYEIRLLKDVRDRNFRNDLIKLFKMTQAMEIVKETFSQARSLNDPDLLEEIHDSFIQAAEKINPKLHVLVLIEANESREAATIFFSQLYPSLIKTLRTSGTTRYYFNVDETFLEIVLPKIMAHGIEKAQDLLERLIHVNIKQKNRSYYQIAAKWAEILRTLLVDVKRQPHEWENYIKDLLLVRYRRRTALKDEMRHLMDA